MHYFPVFLVSAILYFGTGFTSDSNGIAQLVCGIHEQPCETYACYSPGRGQVCLRNGTTIRVCSHQQQLCGSNCFSPVEGQACFWPTPTTSLICPFGNQLCFGNNTNRCYDPRSQSCLQHGGNGYICNYGDRVCGRWCYNPQHAACYNDEVRCLVGDDLCGRFCYSKGNGGRCLQGPNGPAVCGNGNTALCGSQCYSPERGQSCYLNGTSVLVCPFGNEICPLGARACYSPGLGQRCFQSPAGQPRVCGFNQQLCGESRCFNPSVGEQCFT